MRILYPALFGVVGIVIAGCNGGTPTEPARPAQLAAQPVPGPGPSPVAQQQFEVTGVVTDQQGAPVAGAKVTMALFNVAYPNWPSTQTDAAGNYRITVTALMHPAGFVARAQIVASGFEEYWRNLKTDGATNLAANFNISRIMRIGAGETVRITVAPDLGECPDWDGGGCVIVRVGTTKAGRLIVDVFDEATAARPLVEILEHSANPATLTVAAGSEVVVKIAAGQDRSPAQSLLVRTSIEPE